MAKSEDPHRDRHHTRDWEPMRLDDDEQEIWCSVVNEWMTRGEHRTRFRLDEDQEARELDRPKPGS